MTDETLSFETEVGKILQIVANSLYSDKQIFLRELISNSSDALDKIRYESLTNTSLLNSENKLEIKIIPDKKNNTLRIEDT